MTTQPVILSGAIYALLNAVLALVVGMGWYPLTAEQMVLWNTLFAAVIAVGTYFVQKRTTSLANPRDEDGAPLSRADNSPTIAQVRGAKR